MGGRGEGEGGGYYLHWQRDLNLQPLHLSPVSSTNSHATFCGNFHMDKQSNAPPSPPPINIFGCNVPASFFRMACISSGLQGPWLASTSCSNTGVKDRRYSLKIVRNNTSVHGCGHSTSYSVTPELTPSKEVSQVLSATMG